MNIIKMLGLSSLLIVFSSCISLKKNEAEPEKFVIINVLDKDAYDDCKIIGSLNVPFENVEKFAKNQLKKKTWNHDTEIVVHCSNYKCTASWTGANTLQKIGFKKVWAYEAGTAEAHQEQLTVGPCKASYLSDYKEPEGYDPKPGVNIIDTITLKKKMQEFALIKQS